MFIQLFIAMIFSISLTISGHYYVYLRILQPILGYSNFIWITIFSSLCALSFFGFLIIRILPNNFRKFVEFIMFMWMGCLFIFLLLCLVTIPLQVVCFFLDCPEKYLSYFILYLGSFIILYSIYLALKKPTIIPVVVPMPSTISKSIEDISIVVLSDIHVSGLIGRKKMLQLTQRVNDLNPDFIFLTGDLMDGSLKQLKNEIEPLKHLKAKEQVLYITGNHEYYSGPMSWKNHFETNFKWHVFSNSSKIIHFNGVTINILGLEDKHWLSHEKIPRKKDVRLARSVEHLHNERALQDSPLPIENCVNILLAHQPKDAKYLVHFPWIHLQISGHTHGGQIWPLKYFVYKDQKYNSGLYNIRHNQNIYVNQGTGFWGPPMRLGTKGEITLMRFKVEEIISKGE